MGIDVTDMGASGGVQGDEGYAGDIGAGGFADSGTAWGQPAPVPLSYGVLRELPPRHLWDFYVRGWRPTGAWICNLVLLVYGAVVPLTQLAQGKDVLPLDFAALAVLAGSLGYSAMRTIEKLKDKTI